ncbi:MAG: heparinase II/III family protein [Opitutaceae bacterium]|nr:heparinase II/III family protein [Opitutaceae bacterium]
MSCTAPLFAAGDWSPPSPERIREIAAMLPEEPAACGPSIRDRAAWTEFAARAEPLVREADLLLEQPVPELPDELYLDYSRTGNRTGYQRPYGLRSYRLFIFAQAECATDTGRYLPALEAELRAILAEKTWVLPAHDSKLKTFNGESVNVDLGAAHRAGTLAVTLSWFGDRLPADLRKQTLAELDRRVFAPYLRRIRTGEGPCGWVESDNNWNAVCNAAVATAALAVIPDRAIRAEIVAGAEKSLAKYFSGFTDDGWCREGVGYWNYGFGHYAQLAEAVLRATGGRLDLFANPKVQKITAFPANLEMDAGLSPSFGDARLYPVADKWILGLTSARLGWTPPGGQPEPPAVRARGAGPLGSSLYTAAIRDFPLPAAGRQATPSSSPPAPPAPPAPDPLRGWFPDGGVLVCRMAAGSSEKTDARGFSAAFKGGSSARGFGNHDHHDLGQFVVAIRRRAPVVDPGAEPYTARTFSPRRFESEMINSFGHSVPRVAGQLQRAGAKARVLAHAFSPLADTLTLDLRDAYDVPSLVKLERTFVFSRERGGSVTITDHVEFSSPETFEGAAITYGSIRELSPVALTLTEGPAALRVEFASDAGEPVLSQKRINVRFRRKPVRIGAALREPVICATFTCRITPDEPATPVSFVEDTPRFPDGLQPDFSQAWRVEAETVASQARGAATMISRADASGQALGKWADRGHALTWRIGIESPDTSSAHGIRIRYRTGESLDTAIGLRINGQDFDEMLLPSTLDQGDRTGEWNEAWLCSRGTAISASLRAGENDIRLTNRSGGEVMLDWLELVPMKPGS